MLNALFYSSHVVTTAHMNTWQGLATVMRRSGQDSLVLGMVEETLVKAKEAGMTQEATNVKMLLGQLHALQV